MDAIDGKQARRTKSNSPLGELFDHGCDALSTVFVAISLCLTLKIANENPWFMFIIFNLSLSAFYAVHWSAYVTGVLRFEKFEANFVFNN